MVVENILPSDWVEKKTSYAFFLGSVYAIIGIIIAKMFFPDDPSLVAVGFTSILLLPLLRKLFRREEDREKKERSFSLKHLWRDQGDFVKVYLLLAAGIFVIYCIASMVLPGFEVSSLFREQIEIRTNVSGQAISLNNNLFVDILINNWWVLVACILLSLFTGDGAIFLITWNASLWGTIFGVTARNAAYFTDGNPWIYLIVILCIVLPHATIEMLSYIMGGIAGGLVSSDIELEPGERSSDRFKKTFYTYILSILVIALILLLIGASLEAEVLQNVTAYRDIVINSHL